MPAALPLRLLALAAGTSTAPQLLEVLAPKQRQWVMNVGGGTTDVDGLGTWNPTAALGPAVLSRSSNAKTLYTDFGELPRFEERGGGAVYGGLPQLANCSSHLRKIRAQLSDPHAAFPGSIAGSYYLPRNYSGVISIDYEAWNPWWDGCCGAHAETYLNASVAVQRRLTPGLNTSELERRAKLAFQDAALAFWVRTVREVRALRPLAQVGIYNWPNSRGDWDASRIEARELFMMPFYREVNSFQPSIYLAEASGVGKTTVATTAERVTQPVAYCSLLAARISQEAQQQQPAARVHAFAWYRYNRHPHQSFLSNTDFEIEMREPFNVGADQVLIWGYELSAQNKSDAIRFLDSQKATFNATSALKMKMKMDDAEGRAAEFRGQPARTEPRPPVLQWHTPPIRVPCDHQTDAPLAGDGITGVQLAGAAHNLTLLLARNDFWKNQIPRAPPSPPPPPRPPSPPVGKPFILQAPGRSGGCLRPTQCGSFQYCPDCCNISVGVCDAGAEWQLTAAGGVESVTFRPGHCLSVSSSHCNAGNRLWLVGGCGSEQAFAWEPAAVDLNTTSGRLRYNGTGAKDECSDSCIVRGAPTIAPFENATTSSCGDASALWQRQIRLPQLPDRRSQLWDTFAAPIINEYEHGGLPPASTATDSPVNADDCHPPDGGQHADGGPAPLPIGGLTIDVPALAAAEEYLLEQDTAHGEIRGTARVSSSGAALQVRAVAAMPAARLNSSVVIVELLNNGTVPLNGTLRLFAHDSYIAEGSGGSAEGMAWVLRTTARLGEAEFNGSIAAVALRTWPDLPGLKCGARTGGFECTANLRLAVGGTTVVTLAVGGSPYLTDDSSAPKLAEAIAAAAARMTHAEAVANLAGNRNWWRSFWARGATVSLPSRPRIESFYYSSHYLLATASSAIANATAPGLWGPWVTTDYPMWSGGFTLDYNFEAPYYSVYSSDRLELANAYYTAIFDYLPRAIERGAKVFKCPDGAASFPVTLNPYKILRVDDKADGGPYSDDLSEKWLGLFVAVNVADHWLFTRDAAWVQRGGYQLLKAVAALWLCLLEKDPATGLFVDKDDCATESLDGGRTCCCGAPGKQDPSAMIALLARVLHVLLDINAALSIEDTAEPRWRDVLVHLPRLHLAPSDTLAGNRSVILPTARGQLDEKAWVLRASVNVPYLYPMFPGRLDQLSGVHKDGRQASAAELRLAAAATLDAVHQWSNHSGRTDVCAFATVYPAAARLGYNATTLLAHFDDKLRTEQLRNGLVWIKGGALESVGVTVAVNEMLLQSSGRLLRFFPTWPLDEPASFSGMRAEGGLIVGARISSSGTVSGVSIGTATLGDDVHNCSFVSPWLHNKPIVAEAGSGDRVAVQHGGDLVFSFALRRGVTYLVARKGEAR